MGRVADHAGINSPVIAVVAVVFAIVMLVWARTGLSGISQCAMNYDLTLVVSVVCGTTTTTYSIAALTMTTKQHSGATNAQGFLIRQ